MTRTFQSLSAVFIFAFTLASTAVEVRAEYPIPDEVLVGADAIEPTLFTLWTEKDPAKYSGTFAGDVGGDGSGKLTIKVTKGEKDGPVAATASGTYTLTVVTMEPSTVAFKNATSVADFPTVFSPGVFDIVFVKYDGKKGVIVGKTFLPME